MTNLPPIDVIEVSRLTGGDLSMSKKTLLKAAHSSNLILPTSDTSRTGTQSIERSLLMLKKLAARGEFGWQLSELAASCGVNKGTAHRILTCLVRERFAQQRQSDRRYFPGPQLYELGLSVPGHVEFQAACRTRLSEFANKTKALAWLIFRSGNEYVCAIREGDLTLNGFMVHVGTRRPLFTSVGGVTILHSLPPDEAQIILKNNIDQEVARRGDARLGLLKQMRVRSQRHGFGVNLGDVVAGVHALAVSVCDPEGDPFAAVCLAGSEDILPEEQLEEFHIALKEMRTSIEHDAIEYFSSCLTT